MSGLKGESLEQFVEGFEEYLYLKKLKMISSILEKDTNLVVDG